MLRYLVVILTIAISIESKIFNNPIIEGGIQPTPSAIKVNETYYIISRKQDGPIIPIYTSTDLNNWTHAGDVFNETHKPNWSDPVNNFWAPEIHQIGSKFYVYFVAMDANRIDTDIGVAVANHPLGPYEPIDHPIFEFSSNWSSDNYDFTIINDNGDLYLMLISDGVYQATPLTPDGLALSSNKSIEVTKSYLAPFYMKRNDYHYLIYSVNDFCENRTLGVARSRNALGPYEERNNAFMIANDNFRTFGSNSLVPDLDGNGDVIVFHASQIYNGVYDCIWNDIVLASIKWDEEGWPHVYDF